MLKVFPIDVINIFLLYNINFYCYIILFFFIYNYAIVQLNG